MPSTKEIRRRIKSVRSTRQITKAMEMVSAAKMRKAQQQDLAARAYARHAWELVRTLADKSHPGLHKLLRRTAGAKSALVVLMTSNRGLIGSFNTHLASAALEYAKQFSSVNFLTLGRKGRESVRKSGMNIAADFEKKDVAGSINEISALANLAINDFLSGKYDRVSLVYMDFVSTLAQKPKVLELLPLFAPEETGTEPDSQFLFEPSADFVLDEVLPRLTSMQIYQALLETNASEHSARMVAMKSASDAAGDIISDLTLEFNQLRQANITKEISEIVSGRMALSN